MISQAKAAIEEDGRGGGEEGAHVGAEGKTTMRGGRLEGGDGVGEVEEIGGFLEEGKEVEGMLVDDEGGVEGLDAAAALDLGEVRGDLMIRGRLRQRHRHPDIPGVVKGPSCEEKEGFKTSPIHAATSGINTYLY